MAAISPITASWRFSVFISTRDGFGRSQPVPTVRHCPEAGPNEAPPDRSVGEASRREADGLGGYACRPPVALKRVGVPFSSAGGAAGCSSAPRVRAVAAILVLVLLSAYWSGGGTALAQTIRAMPAGPAGRAGPASRAIPASPSNPPLPASPPTPAYSAIQPQTPFEWPSELMAQGQAFDWRPNGPGRWSPSLVPDDRCSESLDRECNPTPDRHRRLPNHAARR
jgi:hypothetical protein